MLVKCSQKQSSWLISTMNSFGNNNISLVYVLYKNSVIPNTLCKIICSQSPFAYCHVAILIFCLNVSCHATMNIWINCTNNKELWPLTMWSRRHTMCSLFTIKGGSIITSMTFWLFFFFANYGWGARIYTCEKWTTAFLNKQEQVYMVPQWLDYYFHNWKYIILA